MITLQPDYARFGIITTALLDINQRAKGLDVAYQKLIAETLMLRLFYELDQCVEGVILKLIRGVPYLDGSTPLLMIGAFRSQDAARQYIIRTKRQNYLEWTTLPKITRNLTGILDLTDHFMVTRSTFDGVYEDMRHVRNHVAHNSASTRAKFASVVQKVYLVTAGINAAKFLLSQRTAVVGYTGSDMVVAQYIRWSRVFVKALTKSPS
jgi:hypothetical protein